MSKHPAEGPTECPACGSASEVVIGRAWGRLVPGEGEVVEGRHWRCQMCGRQWGDALPAYIRASLREQAGYGAWDRRGDPWDVEVVRGAGGVARRGRRRPSS